jgi:hypothetical protein
MDLSQAREASARVERGLAWSETFKLGAPRVARRSAIASMALDRPEHLEGVFLTRLERR